MKNLEDIKQFAKIVSGGEIIMRPFSFITQVNSFGIVEKDVYTCYAENFLYIDQTIFYRSVSGNYAYLVYYYTKISAAVPLFKIEISTIQNRQQDIYFCNKVAIKLPVDANIYIQIAGYEFMKV